MLRKMLALAAALALLLCAGMALAEENAQDTLDVGGIAYSASDVETLKAYLDVGATGTLVNSTYTPADPATYGVEWAEVDGVHRAVSIEWEDLQIAGDLSLAGMECLKTLSCSRNQLTSLDLTGCYQLTDVYCDHNKLASLVLSGCVSLSELSAEENELTEIDLKDCVSLTSLFVSNNLLTSLSVEGLPALTLVQCDGNALTGLTVRGCPALESVYCQNNSLPFLNLSGCANLKTLHAQDNLLLAVNLTGCDQLTSLRLDNNRLTALPDLTEFTALSAEDSDFTGNSFREEDLARLPASLTADSGWMARQTADGSAAASAAEPVPDTEPGFDLSTLGKVFTNRQGTVFGYDATAEKEPEGWALVVAAQPNKEKYHQRNLTLSADRLTELKEAGFFEIAVRMNDVTVYVPISELLTHDAKSYILLVVPITKEERSKDETAALNGCELISSSCRYRVAAVSGGVTSNITDSLNSLRVRVTVPTPETPDSIRLLIVSNQSKLSDMTYYVPSAVDGEENTVFTADISGTGSGLIALIRMSD